MKFFLLLFYFCADLLFSLNDYSFEIKKNKLKMKDGVSLSVTYFRPTSNDLNEKFPVLLELLPYRKDDFFYQRDYPIYSFFAKNGFIMAKVDIRGTGSSEGKLPDREYSEIELQDAVELIDQLSKIPQSNGNVGMWGISWGGFNALQVRSLKPPALKAILAMHTSDDLFNDDIHYIDGILHMDPFAIGVEVDLIFPRSPEYKIDDHYFKNNFETYPWFLTYLKNQRDGDFWRKKSRRFEIEKNSIPIYMIGGLLDGYRDTVLRILENEDASVLAEIGPWNHDFPDTGHPGPNYEWKLRAIDWWNQWLKNSNENKNQKEKKLIIFVRESSPKEDEATTKGTWQEVNWPPKNYQTFFLAPKNRLSNKPEAGKNNLKYIPTQGTAAGNWWGEVSQEMSQDDQSCLVFDSAKLNKKIEMIGFPEINFSATTHVPLVHWVARLEDISEDGSIVLVTGGALNGSQRKSRLHPEPLTIGAKDNFLIPLHFSTWIFHPQHKIRLSLCHGQFPMFWPSPYLTESQVHFGKNSLIKIPIISDGKIVSLPSPLPLEYSKNAEDSTVEPHVYKVTREDHSKSTKTSFLEQESFRIDDKFYNYSALIESTVSDLNPATTKFYSVMNADMKKDKNKIHVKTEISLNSDEKNFYAIVERFIFKNEKLLRQKKWEETIPRDFN